MTRFEQEQLFGAIARAYVIIDGDELLDEQAGLPEAPLTPRLDARVARIGRRRAWVSWAPGMAAVAAGLLLAVVLSNPALLRLPASAPPAAGEVSNPATAETPDGQTLIPLNFTLPEPFSVTSADTDHGQTIYRLESVLHDPVVLTLEYAEAAPDVTGLRAMPLGDTTVYGTSAEGYQMLVFTADGLVYCMTCRYDMSTLLTLAEAILL